jgi:hypothetical protein
MGAGPKDEPFLDAKEDVIENLEAIQLSLIRCVDEGMIDLENAYYNQVLDLQEDARIVDTWEELGEIVAHGKTLEADVAAWLSLHGRTSVSLPWPKGKPTH